MKLDIIRIQMIYDNYNDSYDPKNYRHLYEKTRSGLKIEPWGTRKLILRTSRYLHTLKPIT